MGVLGVGVKSIGSSVRLIVAKALPRALAAAAGGCLAAVFIAILASAVNPAAAAASAPVQTEPASGVRPHQATLNGFLEFAESEEPPFCDFLFRIVGEDGIHSVACQPSGIFVGHVSATIFELQPNTTYEFFAEAGFIQGSPLMFTTPREPPTVTTGFPTSVTPTEATLQGSVNPKGGPVARCDFELGRTTEYGTLVPCAVSGEGETALPVSATASLTPRTLFHYRLVAARSGGEEPARGEDVEFETPPKPPIVETTAATGVTQTGATLNGRVNPEGAPVETCFFEVGKTTEYETSVPCLVSGEGEVAVPVSALASSLSRNTTYHYRLAASHFFEGGVVDGADRTFKTLSEQPTVETLPATAMSRSGATLNGSVNPNGMPVEECRFEYGTTQSYGKTAACTVAGAGTTPVPVAVPVAGLQPNTEYHFRLTAKNSGGSGFGADETFKTRPIPPAVQTLPATALSQTDATLNGSVNPNGAPVEECRFEYGTTQSYGKTAACTVAGAGTTPVPVAVPVVELQPNTEYHFRLTARTSGGSGSGLDESFKTRPVTPAVQTLPATAISRSGATLNGSVNPDGAPVEECRFEYGTTQSYGKTAACTVAGAGTTPVPVAVPVAGLQPNTEYHFRLTARNSAGSGFGADESFKTRPAPPAVQTLPATALSQTEATLNGSVDPEGVPVEECRFEYGTTQSYGKTAACTVGGAGTTPVPVAVPVVELQPNTEYHFRLTARTAGGSGSGLDQSFKTRPVPPAVQTLPATAVSQTGATLNGSVNPNGAPVEECRFEYGTTQSYGKTAACTVTGAGTTPVPVAVPVAELQPNTEYHFRLTAKNSGGLGVGTDSTLRTPPPAPTVETELATAVTQTEATLNGSVNPNGAPVEECRFEYGTTQSYGKTAACTVAGAGTTPVPVAVPVAELQPNTEYHFRLTAKNSGGLGVGTDSTLRTPPPAPTVETELATAVTQTEATLNGSVNPNGAPVEECRFEYGTTQSYGKTAACTVAGAGTTPVPVAVPVAELQPNTEYHFRLTAKNSGGPGVGTDSTLKTPPTEPTVETELATAVTQTNATLNGIVDPNGAAVESCRFEYGTTQSYGSEAPCSVAGAGTSPVEVSVPVAELQPGTEYHFRLTAGNSGGPGVGADHTFKTIGRSGSGVNLTPPAPKAIVGTTLHDTAIVTQEGLRAAGVSVTFKVTGANPQTAVVISDATGEATFSYQGAHPGTDHIVATFLDQTGATVVSNEVTTTWFSGSTGGNSGSGGSAGGGGSGGGPGGGVLPFKAVLPAPVLGKTVNVEPVSGRVFVKLPPVHPTSTGKHHAALISLHKGAGFIPLTEARQVPVGSTLDTTEGVVKVTTATTAKGATQFGDFGAGIFTILQNRAQRGLADLHIVNVSPRQTCASVGKKATAARRRLSSRVLGRLNGEAHGRFRTEGQYSAATVRGTIWSVSNRCDGTLTQVTRGIVAVADFRLRKTITLRAGQHYLAKAS